MPFSCFLLIALEVLQQGNQYGHHFVEENMTTIFRSKERIYCASLRIIKVSKLFFFAHIVATVQILIRNDYPTSEEHKTQNM